MRKLLISLLVLIPVVFATSCTRHTRIIEQGEPGSDGSDGSDGINGRDGLNGLGFDYVRGMDGATVCNRVLLVDATLVIPEHILMFAPAEDPNDSDGLTLTFGTEYSAFRMYLGEIRAGDHCVIERRRHSGRVVLGQLSFADDGFIALIPEDTLRFFDPSYLYQLIDLGVFIEFDTECKMLDYNGRRIKIGNDIFINLNRD